MILINESICFDESLNILLRNDIKITISEKEKKLLVYFLHNQDSEISKEQLIINIWGDRASTIVDANLTQLIHKLRRNLSAIGVMDCIKTIPRKGYIYIPPPKKNEIGGWRENLDGNHKFIFKSIKKRNGIILMISTVLISLVFIFCFYL